MSATYALEMESITKVFPGVRALDDVTLRVKPGTVHALMGENGAGKSTLMKCLFGIYKEDGGTIKLNGEICHFKDSHDALKRGVSMIHQELSNVPERSVAQNLYLGREPLKSFGIIDHKKMNEDTADLLKRLEIDIKPERRIGSLSISMQQTCEIAKAVSYNSKVVVMDEPTSSLTDNEVAHLFKIIRQLREQNVAIVYISHKMEEIFAIADEVSVMRDGKMIGTYQTEELTNDKLISLMVGRDANLRFPTVSSTIGDVLLKVENLCSPNPRSFQDVSFELRRGEILGIGGLVDNDPSDGTILTFPVIGIDATADALNSMDQNKLYATVLQDSVGQSSTAFELAYAMATKGTASGMTAWGIAPAKEVISEAPANDAAVIGQCYLVPFKPVTKANYKDLM